MVELLGRTEDQPEYELEPAAAILLALHKDSYERTKDLVEKARKQASVSSNTVRDRLKELRDEGLVEIKRGGREGIPELTEVGEELASLIQVRLEQKRGTAHIRRAQRQ